MARGGINPAWIKNRKEEIEKGEFSSIILSYNPSVQWLISYLASRDQFVKVTQLGAGVKKITLIENVCPTCNGKGYVK